MILVLYKIVPSGFTKSSPAVRPAARDQVVRLIFIFYWLLVLEGALRKWGLPQLEQALFFVRVPIAMMTYWVAFRFRCWPRTTLPILAFYLLTVAATLLIPLQLLVGGYGLRYLLLMGYGWLNYFFFIPLAFLIAEQFQTEDIQRLTRHAAWLSIASLPIVVLQFFAPPGNIINLGSGLDESSQFQNLGAALGYVRPTGFFTSTTGQTQFVASTAALLLAALLAGYRNRYISPLLLWLGLGAVAAMTILSQSRSLFFTLGLVFAAAAAAGLLAGRRKVVVRVGLWPIVLVSTTAFLWPLLFPTAFDAFSLRWSSAMESELAVFQFGVFGRVFYGFYGFIQYFDDTPLLGYFLGLGGNAANQLEWVQLPGAALMWTGYGAWAEDGWSRHIVDLGPIIGILFICFRISFTLWLGVKVVRIARRTGNIAPIILFGYVGFLLLQGQITGHGTINGFAWFFVGLCLASTRIVHGSTGSPTIQRRSTKRKIRTIVLS